MSNHSPGPWKVHRDETGAFVVQAKGGRTVTKVYPVDGNGRPREGAEADARVISAAPQMLELLERLNEHVYSAVWAFDKSGMRPTSASLTMSTDYEECRVLLETLGEATDGDTRQGG